MLTADQIEALGTRVEQFISPTIEFLIQDIARRIAQAGQLTATASYQTWRLQQFGISQNQLKRELARRLKVTRSQIDQLIKQAAETGYNFDIDRLPHDKAIPFTENEVLQQIVSAAISLADENFQNITETIGFVGSDGKGRNLTKAYRQACDDAFKKVSTGAQDYVSAIRQATKNLVDRGIVSIDYKSGRCISLEAAVRQSVMGGMGLMQEQISQNVHDTTGCDGWEISAHAASAPDHEPIQGRQYPDEEYRKLNSSLVRRIGTLNCGHIAFPIILGVDTPMHTEKELERLRSDNERGIIYNGQHMTMYQATQRQRALERSIRKSKRAILVAETTGDGALLRANQIRLQITKQELTRFADVAGLRMQHERMEIAGFGAGYAKADYTGEPIIRKKALKECIDLR